MRINVNVYSVLRYYLPGAEKSVQEKEWDMPEGATVLQVLERLKLPREVRVTVLLNSNSAGSKEALKEGDIIHILPQTPGG